MDVEPDMTTDTDPIPEPEPDIHSESLAAADSSPGISLPAGITLNRGTVIKAVVAGLAVVSMVLLWKNRRP